ncbi:uncharacterized protein LOC108630147 [Ceratina calcarata]|uniref:Tetratricopeptide repeat protein 29 n=1 Tax=Ceratina calcarata TaxID=156304 RepID=A0AAJ7SAK0_9HYME|nr:uncharacterized protein LOC108630147 [Ceratina calcarata]
MEFFKKDYKEWSESSDSKVSEYIVKRPGKLRTIPQAHGREMPAVLAELKAALPDISPKEVRRFYMPYHEAILLELEEEGYPEAHRYMKDILKLDEQIAAKTPGMLTWKKPRLKDDKDFIHSLKNGLVTAEQGKTLGDFVLRAMSFMDTALFFQTKTWEWWWIAERLYQSALAAAEMIEHDDYQTITLIRYLYGRFLFNELQNPKEAIDYLEKAREESKGKRWNASKKLGVKQNSIFKESNVLLYKALLILVRNERPNNPARALEFCTEALERATDAGNTEYVNETLYELGKCHVAVNDIKSALQSFSKLLALAKRTQDVDGVCHAHMELAFAYKQLNDNDYTEKHLLMWRNNAEDFGLLEKLADAHYYTGEHYLSQGKLHLSTNHLETALNLYNRLDLSRDADRARCIAGISKGQEIIEKYIGIVLRCGDYDQTATLKLCRWKSNREPFWTEEIYGNRDQIYMYYSVSHYHYSNSICTYIFLPSVLTYTYYIYINT